MSKSQYLQLFKNQTDTSHKLLIDATGENTFFKSDRDIKFETDLLVKQGALYKSVSSQIFVDLPNTIESHYQHFSDYHNAVVASVIAETNARTAADSKISIDISTEAKTRADYDASLLASLQTEVSTRTSADATFTNSLNYEVSRAMTQETLLSQNIIDEGKLRFDADELEKKARADAVAFEGKLRFDADELEKKARADADALLNSRCDSLSLSIDDEKKARLDGYLSLSTRCDVLNSRLNNLTVNTDPSRLDSLSEIVNRMNSTGLDVYARLATIENALEMLRNASLYSNQQLSFAPDIPVSL